MLWGALLVGRATALHAEESAWFTGNWGGVRNNRAERGLDIEFVATTDIMAIVDGGLDCGVEAPANFDLVFTLDTATAGWWKNGNFLVYFLGNSGATRVRELAICR